MDNVQVMKESILKIKNDCMEDDSPALTDVDASENLKEDLLLKSLNIVEILSEFDNKSGIKTKLNEFIHVKTVQDLYDLAAKKGV